MWLPEGNHMGRPYNASRTHRRISPINSLFACV